MSSNPLPVTQHQQCHNDETLEFLELLNDLEYNVNDNFMSFMSAPIDAIPPHTSRYFAGRSRLCGWPSKPVDERPNPSPRCEFGLLSWKTSDLGGPTTTQMSPQAPSGSMVLLVRSTSSELGWKSIAPVRSQQETVLGTGETRSGVDSLASSEREAFSVDGVNFDLEIMSPSKRGNSFV